MRAARLIGGLALALLLQLVGARLYPTISQRVDVFLVVAVLYGLEGGSLSALFYGLAAGLMQDTLSSGPIGLHGFADTAMAYGAARLAQRLVIQRATGVAGVVAFASLVQQAILTAMAFLLLPNPSLPAPSGILLQAGAKALACGLLAMLFYGAERSWRRLAEARRRGRMGPLRLE